MIVHDLFYSAIVTHNRSTEGNRRRYSQNDITRFHFIRRLTRGGVNLEGVRVIIDMADELSALGGNPEAVIERNLQAIDEW